ncbi:hypothetical protein GCM10027169_11140 [Gordonia jinhuaensis]|uniref:Uncharacterized protein n=1 Tax=Gordonia jinhuaensis TaxID=1517702 RepID=A0A916SX48_9ACTN|nr:hypothetical protein GCM10011489_05300 [Gordonia jinhuaensis]
MARNVNDVRPSAQAISLAAARISSARSAGGLRVRVLAAITLAIITCTARQVNAVLIV